MVSALLRGHGMRVRASRLWFLVALVGAALIWYLSGSLGLEQRMMSLADHPDVRTAFQDRESGRSDALITLISFAILTPIAAGLVGIVVVLLIKGFETLLVSMRLPGWLSAPVVVLVLVFGVYTMSESWVSESRYAAGFIARAYLVYSYGTVPVFH